MEYVLHYDTSSSIGIIILVYVPEAQGTATYCEFSRLRFCVLKFFVKCFKFFSKIFLWLCTPQFVSRTAYACIS